MTGAVQQRKGQGTLLTSVVQSAQLPFPTLASQIQLRSPPPTIYHPTNIEFWLTALTYAGPDPIQGCTGGDFPLEGGWA